MKDKEILNVLENSHCYEGLPDRKEQQRLLKLLRFPALDAYYSWTVFVDNNLYYLRRIVLDQRSTILPRTYGSEIRLPKNEWEKIITVLQNIKIKPFLQNKGLVIDGIVYGVELGGIFPSCRLTWNTEPPEEWNEVKKWFDKTVAYFEKILPPCTLEYEN